MRTRRVAALATGAAAIVGGLAMRKKAKNRKADAEASSSNGFSARGMTETASSMKDEAEQRYADLRES